MIWVVQHDCLHTGKAENPVKLHPQDWLAQEYQSDTEAWEGLWKVTHLQPILGKRSWVPAVKDSSGRSSRADAHITRKKASRWCRFLSQPLVSRQQQSDDEYTGEWSSLLSSPKKYPFTFTQGVHLIDHRAKQVYV